MPLATLSAASLAFLTTAFAAQPASDPSAVPSGTYELDPNHTTVIFGVSHGGFSTYRGSFTEKSGTLEWNAEDPTQSTLMVTLGAGSVDSPEAESHSGNADFQEDISINALGADEHPEITFTSTSLERTDETSGIVTGDLTFNGQTAQIQMPVTLVGAGEMMGSQRIGFSGTTTLDRTQWGSDAWTDFGIGTEVAVTIEAEFAQGE